MSQAEYEFVDRYKFLARNPINHAEIIKDVRFLQLLACILDRSDVPLVKSALQTIQLLAQNKANHVVMKSTFGIMETVQLISKRYFGVADDLVQLSNDIITILEIPAFGTKSCEINQQAHNLNETPKLRTKVITLMVHGLCEEKQDDLEMALVRVKAVVSFTVDVIHQRCTVRVLNHATPKLIVEAIAEKAKLQAKLVTRNKFNQEVLVSVVNDGGGDSNEKNLPPYLSEEASPAKDKAVSMLGGLKENASGIYKWFQESFYW